MSNVNNLNGIPNFGYGFPEEAPTVAPTEVVEETIPEVALEGEPLKKIKKK